MLRITIGGVFLFFFVTTCFESLFASLVLAAYPNICYNPLLNCCGKDVEIEQGSYHPFLMGVYTRMSLYVGVILR